MELKERMSEVFFREFGVWYCGGWILGVVKDADERNLLGLRLLRTTFLLKLFCCKGKVKLKVQQDSIAKRMIRIRILIDGRMGHHIIFDIIDISQGWKLFDFDDNSN